jgi:hypothetical protein
MEIYLAKTNNLGVWSVAVHQGGKACLLSPYDEQKLKKCGIEPSCAEHRHARIADAEDMCRDQLLRRIPLPGRVRFVWTSDQSWQAVRGGMQLVSGSRPDTKRHLRYPIPAVGARARSQVVAVINAERP